MYSSSELEYPESEMRRRRSPFRSRRSTSRFKPPRSRFRPRRLPTRLKPPRSRGGSKLPSAKLGRPRPKQHPKHPHHHHFHHPRGCRCPVCAPVVAPPLVESASEFVRWVQSTLNRTMGLRLPVNGIISPNVRSAIRSFQRRERLPEDGIVGPPTEAALRRASDAVQHELFLDDNEFEQEVYINRKSKAYIRWVQASLNKILGIKLAVDGISGPKTRSAVRTFQSQRGLSVDGIVGPQTERVLIAAGVGGPPSSSTTSTKPYTGGRSLRNNIARLAVQEWQRWGKGNIKESNPDIRSVLEDYWRTGVGRVPNRSRWWSTTPWSAAFISWVVRKAGAGNTFKYSSGHTTYVGKAKLNRLANNNNPFKAYRISEVAPRVGDLVCVERSGSGVTYDNVDKGFRASHCDIVTQVRSGSLTKIGGNVSNSVSAKKVRIDSKGRITTPGYYAVVRVGR